MKDFPLWLKVTIWLVIGSTGAYMAGSIVYAFASMIYRSIIG
jgi:hypothetical protein